MKTRFIKQASIFTFLIMSPFLIVAQDTEFDDWDTDNDGLIERYEFTNVFTDKFFSAWDPDNEKGLIEEGFFKESYAGLDTDSDGFLSDEEWLTGYNYFYEDYVVYEDYDMIDVNDDGKVTYDEYYDVIYDTEYFSDIDMDSDNYISEYELADYVFENWDFNDSGALSKSEYNRFDWYYLDV